jgi:hypothetical protein
MAKAKEMVGDAVDTARPYVERLAQDEELHDHVKKAYESARTIYNDLLGDRGTTGMAFKVARDKDIQNELKRAVEELRKVTLLMAGIALGVLFNPATGPDTRRWLKDKLFGPEQPFDSVPSEGNGGTGS